MTHIYSLPSEVLSIIFSFLSLKDRKSIRLTCKLWWEVCTDLKFTKNEKFVLCMKRTSPFQTYTVYPYQSFPQISRTHWEFHGLSLMYFSHSLWTLHGNRIEFLFLYNCYIDESTFANIVQYCTSLIHFRMAGTRSELFPNHHTPALDHLINQGIKQEKLITLELDNYRNIISRPVLMKIFRIYPNIRTFAQGCTYIYEGAHRIDCRYTKHYTVADGDGNPYGEWAFPPDNMNAPAWILPTIRLKEFKTLYSAECNYLADFLNFFSQQPELECVWLSVYLGTTEQHSIRCVSHHVLESLPKLKEFLVDGKISWGQTIYLSPEEFGQFLERIRGLEALALRSPSLYLDPYADYSQELNKSLKLTRLKKLYLGPLTQDVIVIAILDLCSSSLQFLGLDLKVCRRISQKIFKIHTNLETLRVTHVQGIYKVNSRDNHYSFSRLQNLKRLYLQKISDYNLSTLVSDFSAPNLEYINFPEYVSLIPGSALSDRRTQIFERMLRKLSLEAPLLKIICFCALIPMSVIKLIEDCKRLRKLKLIYVRQDQSFLSRWVHENYVDIRRLFIECPSLCWLASEHYMYSYDHGSKELVERFNNVCTFKQEYKEWCDD